MTKIIKLILYDKAVKEAKTIVASVSKNLWRLAELAAKLEPKYGEQTLAKFASEIGLSYKSVSNYKRTYLRFEKSEMSARADISTLQRLITVPHAEEIIKIHPNITKRQAGEVAKRQRALPMTKEDASRIAKKMAKTGGTPSPKLDRPYSKSKTTDVEIKVMALTDELEETIPFLSGDLEGVELTEIETLRKLLLKALEALNSRGKKRFNVITGGGGR